MTSRLRYASAVHMSPPRCTNAAAQAHARTIDSEKTPAPVALPPRCAAVPPCQPRTKRDVCAKRVSGRWCLGTHCLTKMRHSAILQPMHHAQASSTRCTAPMMRRSGAVPSWRACHSCSPCAMCHAHNQRRLEGKPTEMPTVRCCSPSLVLVHAWSVRSTEHSTSSTACLLRCFRKHASNASPRALTCISGMSASISSQITKFSATR